MRAETHFPAFSRVSKPAMIMAIFLGLGTIFRVTWVITPNVPSAPTNSRSSWYPQAFFNVLVPSCMISPVGRTTSRPRT
ncbi:MAG: hypothetical protein A4E31_00451 [Methanomassiliicoccales archaeon PtaU1.Bin030]|nr:MAG: hypothetical protein A4E31_00451 [Methanomassiliicoccales archaeon PtaU1.Bin030]